jgi:hypothetical protein
MSGNYPAGSYHRGSVLSRSFLPLGLITLGVVFLLGNFLPERNRGSLVVLGLGVAFLLGRVTTGRYGYAVPAGILLAVGSYIGLQNQEAFQSIRGGGLFFVLLGLGFALVYVIGARPAAIWPLFPATVLIGLGLPPFGFASLGVLASLSWIVGYWPLVLVLLGAWLLFRDHLPAAARRPIATFGSLALLGYAIVAVAASMATDRTLAQTGLMPIFGPPALADTVTLDSPMSAGQTFTVNNPSGRTIIRGGGPNPGVHVVATRHFSFFNRQAPDVRLTPSGNGVSLDVLGSSGRFPFGGSNSVDYTIDVPNAVQVKAQSSSGQIEIDGVGGAVQADASSGQINLTNLGGAVQARSASGSVQLSNIAGEVRASTSSGQIKGTDLRHVREVSSSSGSILLEGTFVDPAQIRASSGSVNVKLLPGSVVRLDVLTHSGSVVLQGGLQLSGGVTKRDRLTGAVGDAPTATLSIETSSGSVLISQ